uniref:Uncharacterized protein n=1 Tax=Arundo donax TaxID=35708 RepID=A0A0A9C9D5_ARUDO
MFHHPSDTFATIAFIVTLVFNQQNHQMMYTNKY